MAYSQLLWLISNYYGLFPITTLKEGNEWPQRCNYPNALRGSIRLEGKALKGLKEGPEKSNEGP